MPNADSNLDFSITKEPRRRLTEFTSKKRAKSLLGRKFDRLTPFGLVAVTKNGDAVWLCRCDCGTFIFAKATHLRMNKRRSCCKDKLPWEPCYIRSKHGRSKTSVYRIWNTMLQRTLNENSVSYKDYGARGISVCERWCSFDNFYEDMGEPPKNYSLDRLNNDKGYYPENCEWRDRKTQARNTRSNRFIEVQGERMCTAEAAERFGFSPHTIIDRLNRGWTPEEAVGLVFKERWAKRRYTRTGPRQRPITSPPKPE